MSDSPLPVPTEQQKRTQFWQLEQAARHAPLTAICRACSRPRGEHPDGRSRHWFVPPDSSPPPAPSPATTPAPAKLKRTGEYTYDYCRDGKVLATIERHPNHGNGHFSIWAVHGESIHHPTRRDAVAWLDKKFGPPASDAPPATWRELAEAVFPNSRPMTKEDRAAFDASAWSDAEPVEIESGPASDAPAPPREPYAPQSGANDIQGTTPAFRSFTPLAASPAQEASPDDWLATGPLRDKLVVAVTVHFVDGTTQRIDR